MSNDKKDKKGKPAPTGAETTHTGTENNGKTGVDKDAQASVQESGAKDYLLMFIALGCLVVAVAAFVLSFFIEGWQTKILIASMVFALACATLLNAQKRRAYSNACKVLQVLSYLLMVACVAVVIVGRMMANGQ